MLTTTERQLVELVATDCWRGGRAWDALAEAMEDDHGVTVSPASVRRSMQRLCREYDCHLEALPERVRATAA